MPGGGGGAGGPGGGGGAGGPGGGGGAGGPGRAGSAGGPVPLLLLFPELQDGPIGGFGPFWQHVVL